MEQIKGMEVKFKTSVSYMRHCQKEGREAAREAGKEETETHEIVTLKSCSIEELSELYAAIGFIN